MIVYRTLYLVFRYGVINWNSRLLERKKGFSGLYPGNTVKVE